MAFIERPVWPLHVVCDLCMLYVAFVCCVWLLYIVFREDIHGSQCSDVFPTGVCVPVHMCAYMHVCVHACLYVRVPVCPSLCTRVAQVLGLKP